MRKLEMGTWYIINGMFIKKRRSWFDATGYRHITQVTWERSAFAPGQAMYIGERTVYDGAMNSSGTGEDFEQHFERRVSHRVYLFVINENRNPIYVHPEDLVDG